MSVGREREEEKRKDGCRTKHFYQIYYTGDEPQE